MIDLWLPTFDAYMDRYALTEDAWDLLSLRRVCVLATLDVIAKGLVCMEVD